MCHWFAVVTPLRNCFLNRYSEYGYDCHGKIRRKDFTGMNGKPYSLIFSAGSALQERAEHEAEENNGLVISVTGKYMFNLSDVPQLLTQEY